MHALRIGGLALTGILITNPAGAALKLHLIGGRPIVDGVYVNGNGPYRFLVDTGATLNHFDPKIAQSIGLTPTFRSELVTPTGVMYAPGAEGIKVSVDSVRAEGQAFLFAGLDTLHQRYPDVQGILGQEFLSRFDYLLNLRGRQIEFGKQNAEAAETRAHFRTVTGRAVVTTSLGSLVLDSGVNQLTLFDVGVSDLTHALITMTGSVNVGLISGKLVIDGRTFWRGAVVAIPQPAEDGAAGLLPVSLFKQVYVCNSESYVAFE
jgi:hypothetical protein